MKLFFLAQVTSVPAAANLQQGEGIMNHLRDLAHIGMKLNVAKIPAFSEGDIIENWKNNLESFLNMADISRLPSYVSDDSD